MKVSLDFDACIGSGSCEQHAPEVFSMDDEGYVHVIDENPPPALADAVNAAAAHCPTSAITVTD